MRVDLHNLEVHLGEQRVLRDIDLHVADGTVMGILGPNGSGKSTLLRTIYRAVRPRSGAICLDGTDVWQIRPREVAQRVAVVHQDASTDFELRVIDVVLMGRTPYKSAFSSTTAQDEELAFQMLSRTGAGHLAHRSLTRLSGGERQRVLLARALTQQAPVLLLDEPTNHLDISFQLELLAMVRSLGITVVTALHDLNLAASYCDEVAVLAAGELMASGPPEEVLTPDLVRQVYKVHTHALRHPTSSRLMLAFDHIDDTTPAPQLKETS